MAIRSFEHGGEGRSRSVEFGRMGRVVVSDRDRRAFDREMLGNRLVLVERRLWVRLVSMHLVWWIVLFLLGCQACRAKKEIKLSSNQLLHFIWAYIFCFEIWCWTRWAWAWAGWRAIVDIIQLTRAGLFAISVAIQPDAVAIAWFIVVAIGAWRWCTLLATIKWLFNCKLWRERFNKFLEKVSILLFVFSGGKICDTPTKKLKWKR